MTVTNCLICWNIKNPDEDSVQVSAEYFLKNFKVCKQHEKELQEEIMKPKNNDGIQTEDIVIDEWINATIEEVQYEEKHEFKGQHARVGEAVRFKFVLEGYQHPKYSRWMTFSYSEKSNLFIKYIQPLVPTAAPYFDFDIDSLKGTGCKLMFSKDDYQGKPFYNIEIVRAKNSGTKPQTKKTDVHPEETEEAPF